MDDVKESLKQEKEEVNKLANGLWNTWNKIKQLRTKNKFAASNVNLKVHEHKNEHTDEVDYFFDNAPSNPGTKKDDGTEIDRGEENRRSAIQNLQVECWLLINGTRVKNTGKYPVNWPDCTTEIFEQF